MIKPSMIQSQVQQVIEDLNHQNKIILSACSGGLDSMVLADILVRLKNQKGIQIIIIHFNHGIRKESDQEQEAVCRYWQNRGVQVYSKKLIQEKDNTVTNENQLRKARYQFFIQAAEETNAQVICTAHHQEDNSETILMRWCRSVQKQGCLGIPKKRVLKNNITLLRPLLVISKKDLWNYAQQEKIPFWEDKTNKQSINIRNLIRNQVIPKLQEYLPNNINKTLAQQEEHFKKVMQLKDWGIERYQQEECQESLFPWVKGHSWQKSHWDQYPELIQTGIIKNFWDQYSSQPISNLKVQQIYTRIKSWSKQKEVFKYFEQDKEVSVLGYQQRVYILQTSFFYKIKRYPIIQKNLIQGKTQKIPWGEGFWSLQRFSPQKDFIEKGENFWQWKLPLLEESYWSFWHPNQNYLNQQNNHKLRKKFQAQKVTPDQRLTIPLTITHNGDIISVGKESCWNKSKVTSWMLATYHKV